MTTTETSLFDQLDTVVQESGAIPAIERLCDELRSTHDYQNLFYAILMRKRVELGVPPFPMSPANELPQEAHEPYEEAIREAGREVGRLHLERHEIPQAWVYFRMLGEPEPIREAIQDYTLGEDDDTIHAIIEIAWQEGIHPQKGFDLLLAQNGICSSITMLSSVDMSSNPDLRDYCVKKLVLALHEQLRERLAQDLEARNLPHSEDQTIIEWIADTPELFGEDMVHIDVSHLSSVVQMALNLPKCPEILSAIELSQYGERLSPGMQGDNDPPFEKTYADYSVFLKLIAGQEFEEGLAYFEEKLKFASEEGYTFPAELMVSLLMRLDRPKEALCIAEKYLDEDVERPLSCPSVMELARIVQDYDVLSQRAKDKNDPVSYLAARIAQL